MKLTLRKDRLELETRKTIYNYISKNPGLHLNELSRKLNIPVSTVNYHINYLKKLDIIIARPNGRYVRYFVTEKIGFKEKEIINLLRQDVPLQIVIFLLLYPNSSQIKISRYLKRHSTTIAFHLDKLIDVDIIETNPNGKEINYKVKNEEDIFDLLDRYGDSLFEEILEYLDNSSNDLD